MRQRTQRRLTDRVDIYRREKVDENEIGQPIHGWVLIAADVPCAFADESTEYVRGDTGESVRRPASVKFSHDASLEADDRLQFDAADGWFSVTGTDATRDHRRGTVLSAEAELQESDPVPEDDIVDPED